MKYEIPGWQSWSPTKPPFVKLPAYFYSPHGIKEWNLAGCKNQKKPVKGWCSWYAYGSKIDENKIISNTVLLKTMIAQNDDGYVLIDDGWTLCGDWKSCHLNKFPNGMKHLSQKIKGLGLKPGLWIAPFWGDPKSTLFQKHPEYFIKNLEGFPILPFNISFKKFRYVIDMENPKVILYVKNCIKKIIEEWGFELLKLDFLNAIYLNPKYKDSKMPDRILKDLLTWLRKTYPKVYTIGCGCPLGPAAGLVDAMRISADITNPYLQNIWPLNAMFNGSRLKQLETNLKDRSTFSKIWHIDPDAFVCSATNGLNKKQIEKLYKLVLKTKGVVFIGDDLNKVISDKRDTSMYLGLLRSTF